MAGTYPISNLLDKMTSADKDYRFMATNDLMTELQKDSIKLDGASEEKVVSMLLLLLRDKNGEVQNLAVKCLGPVVNKVREHLVEKIVETLCQNMVSEKAEELRDISSIGLKTVINELPPNCNELIISICKKITSKLNSIVAECTSKQDEISIQLEVLDIFGDLLSRFGTGLVNYHASILEALLPQLRSPRLAVRKRAITSIGYLTATCTDSLFNKFMENIIHELMTNSDPSVTRTYIQCIGTTSRHSGHRVGNHLDKLMPLLTGFCMRADEHGDEHGDELREYCIQAFEGLVRRCPKEITGHIPTIISICLDFICYDPNYNYDDDGGSDEGMETDGEVDESDEEPEEEYSDDDDISWKVRRASAKCLEATIASRHDMLVDFYKTISPQLISRFKEREENVKVDIFNAYIALLRQTRSSGPRGDETNDGPIQMLRSQVPHLVKSLTSQLRKEKKSIKTRQGAFHLLTELSLVVPGALIEHIADLIPAVQTSLSEKEKITSSNMKIDTLNFLQQLIISHPVEAFHPHIPVLVPAVIQAVYDSFYKISSEGLNVLQLLVRVIRPFDGQPNAFNFGPYVTQIYQCTLLKLKATDIDQEVKERAISCMGLIISILGDHLREELQTCLPIFVDRLRNEITRLTTVKALTQIAASPLRIPLDIILCDGVSILASFLRKNQRALKLSTLMLLDTMFKHYPTSFDAVMVNCIMKELRPLIHESDLHISQLTLNLLTSVSQVHRQSLMTVTKEILPEILVLVKSPLLQGAALNAMLEFLKSLSHSNVEGVGFRQLLMLLTGLVYQQSQANQPIHKNAYHSIAKCVAALTVANLSNPEAQQVVPQFLSEISNNASTDSVHQFALLAIGEIGKHIDLSGIPELKAVLVRAFDSSSEEVKTAASFALGSVAVGNLQEYLPFILSEVDDNPKKQYLLLHALKETISCQSTNASTVHALMPYIDPIWSKLMSNCECEEEGTRNVVADCLGKLTLIDHEKLLPKLAAALHCPGVYARSTVVNAMKFTITDQPQPIDAMLKLRIGEFFAALKDPDINVRRVALVAFNSAAHNKPMLVRDLLDQVMPQLYSETKVRPELIREVEMGPFKHKVDDGLDIRKAAFECMYTLLDSCMDRIDVYEFLTHLEEGLKDHYDIKMLTYLMVVRLATIRPSALLQRMDTVIEALKEQANMKLKQFPVKQEVEQQEELKRSALRAFSALQQIPDAEKCPQVVDFANTIKGTPDLRRMYEGIQKDANHTIGYNHSDTHEENMVH